MAAFAVAWALVASFGWLKSAREATQSRAIERNALERLIQARKDGFDMPSAAEVQAQSAAPIEEDVLPPVLQAFVDDWEGEPARKAQLAQIKRLQGQGRGTAEIVKILSPTVAE